MKNSVFKKFGPMMDCSRNAVMKVESIKKYIDICKDLDYNCFYLYIEDTYEIPDEPYFGYARGRYSVEELKKINAYGNEKGVEVIPCIQTLAHLNAIFKLGHYNTVRDCNDILLIGEEKVYELIDKMFAVMSECFDTRNINIGMDEAHMVGKGKYYDKHGDKDRTELLLEHLVKVAEIGRKYGYTMSMWSDMFFRAVSEGEYYNPEAVVSEEMKAKIPHDVKIIYWDYYHYEKSFYDKMTVAHKKIKDDIIFAGVLGACQGLAPGNKRNILVTKPALESCIDNNIDEVMLTSWGDDGGENSRFSNIPSLFSASMLAKGVSNIKEIKKEFSKHFSLSYDAFCLLDLVHEDVYNTDSKNLLYNDVFLGLLDSSIEEGRGKKYASCARKLARYRKNPEWGYLFETAYALCKVIELKAEIGIQLRKAYQSGDKQTLKNLILVLKEIVKRINKFHKAYQNQWFKENKSYGFEVQDIRIGGLIKRVESCIMQLQNYLDGKIPEILELSTEVLDDLSQGRVENRAPRVKTYNKIVTACDIFNDN